MHPPPPSLALSSPPLPLPPLPSLPALILSPNHISRSNFLSDIKFDAQRYNPKEVVRRFYNWTRLVRKVQQEYFFFLQELNFIKLG